MKRWLKWLTAVSLIFLALVFVTGTLMMPDGSEKVLARLISKEFTVQTVEVPFNDTLSIGAQVFGDSSKTPLLLIHGSPGDWSAWENVIGNETIVQNYWIIAVDRPGYGITTIRGRESLSQQAAVMAGLISSLKIHDIIVVGHSYGGAVAEQLLVDMPALFSLAIFVAPTISPVHMQPRWYNKLASYGWIQKIIPGDLLTSNLEMVGLPASLRQLESKVEEITTPIIYVQGREDVLVPYESMDYFRSLKSSGVNYLLLDDVDHFIPWTDPELINNILIKQIQDNHEN